MNRSTADRIYVRSHVTRDLMQNAALFRTDKLVVWEYVSNGLQYVNPGMSPVVTVKLDSARKRIVVNDNGRGMDWKGLQNFFVMHGENIDRKEGRPGRGRFGTGKSAAFGIGQVLRIRSVRNRTRSCVELTRADIQAMTSEDPIPVRAVEKEVPTQEPNGTTIEVEGIQLKSLDQAGIIRYIERHLARWPKNTTVFVNNHECEFEEPPVAYERRFRTCENDLGILGDIELVIKVSKAPLEEDIRGISILANGVWHETTLAGSENREMSQYIFGEIDVPRLDDDDSLPAPFDMSRSMRLNPENEIVRNLYAFVGLHVESVRRVLAEEDRKRRSEEAMRRLAKQAADIARVINEDFNAFRQQVARVRAKSLGAVDAYRSAPGDNGEGDDLLFGDDVPAEVISEHGEIGRGNGTRGDGNEPPDVSPVVEPSPESADRRGRPAGGNSGRQSRGGFRVQFKNMGSESYRAFYESGERTIYINLDHPQLLAAKGLGATEDPAFRRLAYEVAFSEYAIALASELERRGNYMDTSDPIVDIRLTLNRIARKAASLYAEES